ncbi:alanyl-tRNA synthetase [Candidatus Nitromaritima sp. SCGC AAA799-C22]|nr:alanyl-tRNA synthetase [Candidatus Nitromaritima sp. SCGC AAA799-C22]
MTGNELRKKFLDYFQERGHALVPSASLVPRKDPTLLFTNAGMVQFKNVFLGEEAMDNKRAVSVQKCVRAGGKHNDLEMVGRTARHHTFFEMLGNFSFGDYFKKDAIAYGWEFLTEVAGLPKDRLYISIYKDDDEAFEHWKNDIGIDPGRIIRLGEKDNFWAMGNTGPCGPCSEIHIDQGEAMGCGKSTCAAGCDCDRYLEIWNLVFMQYNRDDSGKLTPLPNPCIDTGMGLERLAAVVQGKHSNYDSDLLMGIINEVCTVTGKTYGSDNNNDVSIRVIADHARATAFLVGDGVLPSNEGRGYVLRRIVRRGLRHGKLLDQKEPFFYRITDHVVKSFTEAYPDLRQHSTFIHRVVQNEEENFTNTLNFGAQRMEEILERVRKENLDHIPGEEIFKLYDTFGFPVDLAEEYSKESGLPLDMDGFNKAMQEQREKAMASWKGSGEKSVSPFFNEFMKTGQPTRFLGYDGVRADGKVLAILKDQKPVDSASTGEEVQLLLDQTPFYGESGGQMGDNGSAFNDHAQLEIANTTKPVPELIVHEAKIVRGSVKVSDALTLEVDAENRSGIALNHSATHLLHAALKEILGDHIKQAGSLVAPDRLRFDYTHFSPLTAREKNRIEERVNEKIRDNLGVETRELPIEDAIKEGATALFGEKYGDVVRVVSMSGFSKELCGGTHVPATGHIGLFKFTSEGGIASGVRRIEAVTGNAAYQAAQKENETLASIRSILKAQPEDEVNKIKKLLEKSREMEKEIAGLKEKLVSGKGSGLQDDIEKVGDISILVKQFEGMDSKTLRSFIDSAKNQLGSGVVVVGSSANGKVLLAAGVTKDLTGRFHAGNLLKEIAGIVGGSGGGRPDMAQAGGTQTEKLGEALDRARQIIREQ